MQPDCTEAKRPHQTGNFFTPENGPFYENFVYEVLKPKEQAIRLLKIVGRAADGSIECELQPSVPIRNIRDQYFALSYCAGDLNNTREVHINGLRFNVFANLGHALEEVIGYWSKTTLEVPRLIWVDQICINQTDVAERSHQVAFMRSIYENAFEVLVCLSTPSSKFVKGNGLRWVKKLGGLPVYNEVVGINENKITNETHERDWSIYEAFFQIHIQNTPPRLDDWSAFYEVVGAPWWRRAWVFQEFMVSKRARFIFHRFSLPWQDFAKVMLVEKRWWRTGNEAYAHSHGTSLESNFNSAYDGTDTSCHVCRIHKLNHNQSTAVMFRVIDFILRSKSNWTGNMALSELLHKSRYCESSDPRDKIYAFLGLSNLRTTMLPKYDTDIEPLMIEVAEVIVRSYSDLNIISTALSFRPFTSRSLPSWVPDWTCEAAIQTQLELTSLRSVSLSYYGVSTSEEQFLHNHNGRLKFSTLNTDGTVLDEIKGDVLHLASESSLSEDIQYCWTELEEIGSMIGVPIGTMKYDPEFWKRSYYSDHTALHGWQKRLTESSRLLRFVRKKSNKQSARSLRNFQTCLGRCIAATNQVLKGDQLWMLAGLYNPLILRPVKDGYRCVSNVWGPIQSLTDTSFVFADGSVDNEPLFSHKPIIDHFGFPHSEKPDEIASEHRMAKILNSFRRINII